MNSGKARLPNLRCATPILNVPPTDLNSSKPKIEPGTSCAGANGPRSKDSWVELTVAPKNAPKGKEGFDDFPETLDAEDDDLPF